MSPADNTVTRFHQVLLQEISQSCPEYLTQPFTVAEIYQNLVPYRSHRDLIGVEMNGDYEDALLRLLAGEGDYLVLDSEVARREIREELQNASPNTGLFRDFAAADVRLNPDHVSGDTSEVGREPAFLFQDAPEESQPAVDITELRPVQDDEFGFEADDGVIGHIELADVGSVAPQPGAEAEEFGSSEDTPDFSTPETLPGLDLEEPRVSHEPQTSGNADGAPEAPEKALETDDIAAPEQLDALDATSCHWCRETLPSRALLNFCPFCGSDMRLLPCPKCGEEVEPLWQYCVSCGTDVAK